MAANPASSQTEQTVTLQHVRRIARYNEWVFSYLKPHLCGRVLELGCGIGTYSVMLRPFARELVCVDRDPDYVAEVREALRGSPCVEARVGTIGEGLDFPAGHFDGVVCLNVLEHIAADASALEQMARWLRPGGKLLLQVPAHPALFGATDRALGHFRRYTRRGLLTVLAQAGFELVVAPTHLFLLAIPGWWWCGKVRKLSVVPESTAHLANAVASASRALERVIRLPLGLTLVTVARVPGKA